MSQQQVLTSPATAEHNGGMQTFHVPYLMWGFWYAGTRRVRVGKLPDGTGRILFEEIYGCCCCPCCRGDQGEIHCSEDHVRVTRASICGCPATASFHVLSVFFAFLLAFLFHLIPSVIVGVEIVLGSPEMHQQLGVVWFGGWPVFIVILILTRFLFDYGLEIKNPKTGARRFVSVGSHAEATAVRTAMVGSGGGGGGGGGGKQFAAAGSNGTIYRLATSTL
eukprot:g1455.t1